MGNFDKILHEYLIREAISLKNVKKHNLTKAGSGAYTSHLDKVFGKGKSRIIIPINVKIPSEKHPLLEKIKEFIYRHDYMISDMEQYIKGTAYKITEGIKMDKRNPVKIGKILQKYEPDGEIEITHRVNGKKLTKTVAGKPLLHEFKNDPLRLSGGEFLMVISRHPYDIAGASTDRSWTSCMDLGFPRIQYPKSTPNSGINKRYIKSDISEGSLIAYLITKNEVIKEMGGERKVSLHKPLSRILIKPHNADDRTVYTLGKPYGGQYAEFKDMLQKWVSSTFHSDPSTIGKVYPNKKLYNDWDDSPDFEFNSGSSVADEILNDMLSYANEKELGNNLTFTTETPYGGNGVRVIINLQLNDITISQPIDVVYMIPLNAYKINSMESGIQKEVLTSIFKQLSDYQNDTEVSVDFNMSTDTVNIEINTYIRVHSDDDKYVDDDYIWDTLHYYLSPLKKLNYKTLQSKIKTIIESYDWEDHNKKIQENLKKLIDAYKHLVEIQLTTPSSPILKDLKVLPPSYWIKNISEATQYITLLHKINNKLTVCCDVKKQFEYTIPPSIIYSEEYQQPIYKLFNDAFKKHFNVDLVKVKLDVDNQWNLLKVFKFKEDNNISNSHWETIKDIHHEIFQMRGRLKCLIGELGELKI